MFRGGFTLDAAQEVAGADLHTLRSLVHKSFLEVDPQGRYGVHELLREYGAEQLALSPAEAQSLHDRHAAYYAAALGRWGEELKGPLQQEALAEADVEIANARAAWEWAVTWGWVELLSQSMEGLGLFYDRPEYVEYCLNGRRGLVSLLEDGLIDDGLWCESSLVYQFAAIAPMVMLADCQQRVGQRPGLHEIVGANGRTLKQSCDAMFHVLAPNGMIPPIGDAYGSRAKLWDNPLYEYAWGLWRDPRYAWLLARSREPSVRYLFVPPPSEKAAPPPIRSILLPEHGYAFLRSDTDERYWSPDAWCAFLTYDRSNVHANADKLSLMLFGQDRMLLADVEGKATVPHAFSSRIQRELNRGGLSQNTVMIDGRDQVCGPRMLRLIEYRDLPDEKRVTAADEEGLLYGSVRQMRTVAMTADYVLDVFQVQCGAQRQIDWIAHPLSEKAAMPAEGNEALNRCAPFPLPRDGAWQWLRDGRSFWPQGPVRLEWREDQARLRLYMLPDGLERVILCGYPATDEPQTGNVPMVIVRQRGKQALFAAVWLIGDGVKNIEMTRMPDHEGRLVLKVSADGRQRRHLVPILAGVN